MKPTVISAPSYSAGTSSKPSPLSGLSLSKRILPGVSVSFTLRNAGPQDLHLLRWGSPFEGAWFGPFMTVRTAKGELKFQGAMRKRGDPSAEDYLLLPAGQSVAATVTLNDAFTLPTSGPLTLQAAWRWHDVMSNGTPPRPRDRHQGLDQDCGSFTLTR